ncbi:hypothetical protein D9757_005662 [Collybiopsis confluens]|uniref:U3 small nucleolar RNA-associated protein 6 N-terminal domain-containing protein n=1 Tax=Collybiopsis confluens TaxID=2823264 RepID=A0A8H5HTD3_9AGAR|nr:hypothetical protein D9757_005662 [Collybiopsis confluens]
MERVQFQQEQMLDELKDLVEKKVFTAHETKKIMKQRSSFEATLVRRVAKKSDFLRYAAYEMSLEHLRRKRVDRLKIPKTPVTVSDFALVRRQFHIFERALKRFKSDVGLWIEYIQVAKREHARSLLTPNSALQLHPKVPALYILAASHELDHLSPTAARSLLQRGIRLNSDSIEMWTEYVKMELSFTESLRRRWDILGISQVETRDQDATPDPDMTDENTNSTDSPAPKDAEMDRLNQPGAEGARARRQILDGVIVKAIMDSAVQALPRIELFESLNKLITTYPSTPVLRASLIAHLDNLLRSTLFEHPRAIKILYTRLLTSTADVASQASTSTNANVEGLRGQALIDGIRRANEMLISVVSETRQESVRQVYAEFALEWCAVENLDENLRLYVLSSLQALIWRQKSSSPSLLCAHIKLMTEAAQRGTVESAKVLAVARRYTSRAPGVASVWLSRLGAEKVLNDSVDAVAKVWHESRRMVSADDGNLVDIWIWGIYSEDIQEKRLNLFEELLNESMGDPSVHRVHEQLVLGYVTALYQCRKGAKTGLETDQTLHKLHHMQNRFVSTGKVWQRLFELEAEGSGDERELERVYELWRKSDMVEATLGWAEWLLKNGKGKEGSELIVRSKGSVGEDEQTALETRWVGVVGAI